MYEKEIAELFKKLRKDKGLSKSAMADLLFVDRHTYDNYEKGKSAPSITEFLSMMSEIDTGILKTFLDIIYPDIYSTLNERSTEDLKKSLHHFIDNTSSDRLVREICFLVFGEHGSNIEPQMQWFTMVDHLPLEDRYIIAELVYHFYEKEKACGNLISTDHIMPNEEVFLRGLDKAYGAVIEKRTSYTTL